MLPQESLHSCRLFSPKIWGYARCVLLCCPQRCRGCIWVDRERCFWPDRCSGIRLRRWWTEWGGRYQFDELVEVAVDKEADRLWRAFWLALEVPPLKHDIFCMGLQISKLFIIAPYAKKHSQTANSTAFDLLDLQEESNRFATFLRYVREQFQAYNNCKMQKEEGNSLGCLMTKIRRLRKRLIGYGWNKQESNDFILY